MPNLEVWDKVSRPPVEALKEIKGGRLSGMTDINPQWRLKAMTEVFGQCGIGWYYEIEKFWTEQGGLGEVMAFVHLKLYTCTKGEWSKPISGIGGSAIVANEKGGLRANDEGFKMATTDALSVAMKQLGVGADIYMGRWDGSKYKDAPPATNGKPTDNPDFKPDEEEIKYLMGFVNTISALENDIPAATECFYDSNLDKDEMTWIWNKLQPFSKLRAAIKKCNEERKNK